MKILFSFVVLFAVLVSGGVSFAHNNEGDKNHKHHNHEDCDHDHGGHNHGGHNHGGSEKIEPKTK